MVLKTKQNTCLIGPKGEQAVKAVSQMIGTDHMCTRTGASAGNLDARGFSVHSIYVDHNIATPDRKLAADFQ